MKRGRGRPRKPRRLTIAQLLGLPRLRRPPGPTRAAWTAVRSLDWFAKQIPTERETPEYQKWLRTKKYRDSDKSGLRWLLSEYERDTKYKALYRLDTIYQALVRYRRSVAR